MTFGYEFNMKDYITLEKRTYTSKEVQELIDIYETINHFCCKKVLVPEDCDGINYILEKAKQTFSRMGFRELKTSSLAQNIKTLESKLTDSEKIKNCFEHANIIL